MLMDETQVSMNVKNTLVIECSRSLSSAVYLLNVQPLYFRTWQISGYTYSEKMTFRHWSARTDRSRRVLKNSLHHSEFFHPYSREPACKDGALVTAIFLFREDRRHEAGQRRKRQLLGSFDARATSRVI